jgi:MYXO-CTERM domain-containing protein
VEIPVVSGERQALVLGVDPIDADRVYVRIARSQYDPRPERLLVSEDGGQSFTTVLELPNMWGFALSSDGRTVWASSGVNRGIWRASEGTLAFEQVSAVNALCLAARGDELWVCADQRAAGFAVGRSTDGGATITQMLGFEEASELVECPRCSDVGIICPAWIPDLRADLRTYFGGADAGMTGIPRDAGIPRECLPDAGPEPPPPPPPPMGGCGCSSVGSQTSPWAALLVSALALGMVRRRRRSR